MAKQFMLTTVDNPFDPFEQFDEWYSFDKEKGYDSSERLDRIVHFTDEMTESEINNETERAIDEIVFHDFLDIYKKVSKELKEVDENLIDDDE